MQQDTKPSPLVVAEIGMNHMGSEVYAYEYLYALSAAHVDAITFQVREPSYYAKQEKGASTFLSDEYYRAAAARTKKLGMQFGIALCDLAKLPFFESIGTDFYKVLSKDITDHDLVAAMLATGKPVYVSTGMSDEDDLDAFFESLGPTVPDNLTLIHTQLSYDDADTNLRAIRRLREVFDVDVAFGLHSTDMHALYASLGFAPSALFFYVKGNRPLTTHKDEAHAIPNGDVFAVVAEIRRLMTMMGEGVKQKMPNRIKDQQK